MNKQWWTRFSGLTILFMLLIWRLKGSNCKSVNWEFRLYGFVCGETKWEQNRISGIVRKWCMWGRDGPWPDLTQECFWPKVNKRPTRSFDPGTFWPRWWDFFDPKSKNLKNCILSGNFPMPNPNKRWLTRPNPTWVQKICPRPITSVGNAKECWTVWGNVGRALRSLCKCKGVWWSEGQFCWY